MALTKRLAILGFAISMIFMMKNTSLAREVRDDTAVGFPYKSLGILDTYIRPPTMGKGGSQLCDPKKDPALCQEPPAGPWQRGCEKEFRCRSPPHRRRERRPWN
ncbi:hypothetical protein OIU77_001298 [Salix suchowensis]|uniref:Uncharacterized protein n=2 Tax=Salix TaxID=40685 RepID=A0A9Q0VPM9_9ROSI|nr:hypothetical protein IMY05_017G0112100 [Salix suchowensis]KAJ6290833.1 hypothetical protein OIU78_026561 [Salix suchowensis]KAJ6370760.1 hypothetical protein OIU77_001298 [Salix suchowensis]KAJ6752701.1 hypothetical protein OIU74_027510 [Salix koriyanagi]